MAGIPEDGVRSQEDEVAAIVAESLHVLLHAKRPVLVVSDGDDEFVAGDEAVVFQVVIGSHIEAVAVVAQPGDGAERLVAEIIMKGAMKRDLRRLLVDVGMVATLGGRIEAGAVERPTIVVGVPGVGGQLQQDSARGVGVFDHKGDDRVDAPAVAAAVGHISRRRAERATDQIGQIKPRFPARNLDVERLLPITAQFGVGAGQIGHPRNDRPQPPTQALRRAGPDPIDKNRERAAVGGEMQPHLAAGAIENG